MIALIDNHDSFSHMLLDYVRQAVGADHEVVFFRNDDVRLEQLQGYPLTGLVLSPGPGRPEEYPILESIIHAFHGKLPLLGVCLGHQAIGCHFGWTLERAAYPMHGKISRVFHCEEGLFRGLPQGFAATRYHSLVLCRPAGLEASELRRSAWTPDGAVMAVHHHSAPTYGIQFHPEAVCTEYGLALLQQWAACIQQADPDAKVSYFWPREND